MGFQYTQLLPKSTTPVPTDNRFPVKVNCSPSSHRVWFPVSLASRYRQCIVSALNHKSSSSGGGGDAQKAAVPNSNYVVPLDKAASGITRPLAEILRDLNKRIPDNLVKSYSKIVAWYHANRMLSFYAPVDVLDVMVKNFDYYFKLMRKIIDEVGEEKVVQIVTDNEAAMKATGWCGEVRDVIFSDNASVTVVYRVTIRGSDGEAYRESTGTILSSDPNSVEPIAAAEEIAFVRACARFGLGLYLYHEE